jgi:hypothetical protein
MILFKRLETANIKKCWKTVLERKDKFTTFESWKFKVWLPDWVTILNYHIIKFILFGQRKMHARNCKFKITGYLETRTHAHTHTQQSFQRTYVTRTEPQHYGSSTFNITGHAVWEHQQKLAPYKGNKECNSIKRKLGTSLRVFQNHVWVSARPSVRPPAKCSPQNTWPILSTRTKRRLPFATEQTFPVTCDEKLHRFWCNRRRPICRSIKRKDIY